MYAYIITHISVHLFNSLIYLCTRLSQRGINPFIHPGMYLFTQFGLYIRSYIVPYINYQISLSLLTQGQIPTVKHCFFTLMYNKD